MEAAAFPKARRGGACPGGGETGADRTVKLLKSKLGRNEVYYARGTHMDEITCCMGGLCRSAFKPHIV